MIRVSRSAPCIVCGGHDQMPRGRSIRCYGYVSSDGRYAHCTRPEHAGNLEPTTAGTFAHYLGGPCRCGVTHAEAPKPIIREPEPIRRPPSDIARAIYCHARSAAGTLVDKYLRSRGITDPLPASLRYAPTLWHKPSHRTLPAMVAAVQDVAGRITAVHRTFLQHDGSRRIDRRMLGPVRGGAVRLAAAEGTLAVSEGIESGLSILQATRIPTWAALSAVGIEILELPETVRRVIIAADGDARGIAAAERAAARWWREGRSVRIARPPAGADANDLLRREA